MKEVQFADDVKEKGKRVPGKYESLSLSYGNRSDSNAHQIQIHRYTKRFPGKYELFAFIGYFEMDND